MTNSKPSKRKTPIDLLREYESTDKKFYGLQRQIRSGSTTVNASNISGVSGGGSGGSGGGVVKGDNLGNHTAETFLNMTIHQVKNVGYPTECNDAVTKCYVDDAIQRLADQNGLQNGGGFSEGIIETVELTLISTPFYNVQNTLSPNEETLSESMSVVVLDI